MQYALHRADNAELREATLLMSQLLTQWAAPPPAAPHNAVLAQRLQELNDTATAAHATRQAALEEARLKQLATTARLEYAAATLLDLRVAAEAERARGRAEYLAFRLARADKEQARRAPSVAVTNTKLCADVQRSFPRAAARESSEWCAHYTDLHFGHVPLGVMADPLAMQALPSCWPTSPFRRCTSRWPTSPSRRCSSRWPTSLLQCWSSRWS